MIRGIAFEYNTSYFISSLPITKYECHVTKYTYFALMLTAVNELDELTNRIFEALATNYVEIRGIRYSLATLHHYITNEESYEFDKCVNYVDYSLCKVPALHPQYCVGRVEYLKTLDKSQVLDKMKAMMYEEAEIDVNPRQDFLVDPLNLCEKTDSAAFDFMSEVKNVYLKQITSVDVS